MIKSLIEKEGIVFIIAAAAELLLTILCIIGLICQAFFINSGSTKSELISYGFTDVMKIYVVAYGGLTILLVIAMVVIHLINMKNR